MKYYILIFATSLCYIQGLYTQSLSPATLPNVKYHLTARPWKALNISRDVYLDRVEGVARQIEKFQSSSGAVIDPYAKHEMQYSTPYFANVVATLTSTGRARDLLQQGIAAMNKATSDIAQTTSARHVVHGEFFIAPLASAIPLYAPNVSAQQLQLWKDRMAKPVEDIIEGRPHNWRTYAMKGEWLRAKNGYVDKSGALNWIENSWLTGQKSRLANNSLNFYHDETSDPDSWPYESVARCNLLAMIAEGYNGTSRSEISNLLKRGTESSLLLQDPSGQGVAGGRSGNHTWNDILLANGYEISAEIANEEGNMRLAGQYRHAAAIAFQSVQRWIRTNGTYSVTKNHFDPKDRIGYATYSYFANYNGNMIFHMAENYLRHKTKIAEQPAPNEIGGYTVVSDDQLASAVANAGGMHMEVCLRGSTRVKYNRYWTALGVVRFARPGWDSRLGPSDGVRENLTGLGVSFAPTFLEDNRWVRLASMPDRYEAVFTTQFTHPLLVRCQVKYVPRSGKTGPTFINNFTITPDGILSTLTSTSSNYGITWPLLTFDGESTLNTSVGRFIASTSFPNGSDQQNFIALHASPQISATDAVRRSAYGDLRPVRMVSGSETNVTFIYPRNSSDPSAEDVRKSYTHSGKDFSTILGKGNIYVGRTSAGGVGTSIDINNDGKMDASFNTITAFVMQLENGRIRNIETDRDVTAVVSGQTMNLRAFSPTTINNLPLPNIGDVVASTDDGNIAENTIDRDFNTRWSARGNSPWIRYYFKANAIIKTVKIAWYKGDERKASFDIQTSLDTTNWTTVFSGQSSGSTASFENYNIPSTTSRYIRIVCHGNNVNLWNAITEAAFIEDTALPITFDSKKALSAAQNHLVRAQAFPDKISYPRSTNPDGTIRRVAPRDWTSGFFPGSLWLLYENTKDTTWRNRAEQWTVGLESQKNNTGTHDVGFILNSSFGEGYRLTGNSKYRDILLQGAKSLATRFNPVVGCIKSWDRPGFHFPVIIDNMMNLEILFEATRLSGDSTYYKIAVKHALTTMANHFRPDNSSYHLVDYDPATGRVIAKVTVQGLNNLSDWARGQSWGLYGFTMCYRETGDKRFLNMAEKIADFYISHSNMPADQVPFWDFDASDYRDASAACIAGSALLELSQFIPSKRSTYYNRGIRILKALSSSNYTAAVGTNNNFILKHSVENKPKNIEVNEPLCFADYYFIEALLRYKKPAPILKAIGGDNEITLSWNTSTGARFYSIKRSLVEDGTYVTIASNISKTKYTNLGLKPNTIYYYKVTSANYSGEGGTSDIASATTNKALIISSLNPINKQSAAGIILSKAPAKEVPADRLATPATETIESRKVYSENTYPDPNHHVTLKLAPNPTNGVITVHVAGLSPSTQQTLSIISPSGISLKTIQLSSSLETMQVDVSKFVSGLYTLEVISGDKVLSTQFIKL